MLRLGRERLVFGPAFNLCFLQDCPLHMFRSIFASLVLFATATYGQDTVVFENNFDHHSAGVYTEAQLEADWNAPPWDNGVGEGRVEIVEGAEAFGGSGSALAVHYPADSFGVRGTGAQWQLELEEEYEELVVSYRVKFRDGFDFVRGGKLPGLAGGSAPTGSAPADGVRGWTGRLMWRTDFTGTSGSPAQTTSDAISYAKHLDSGFDQDGRQEDQVYWEDDANQRIVLESGAWYQIKQHVRMNTPGEADGILQIWLDGVLVLDQNNLRFRSIADLKIDQMFFSTFFGGGSSWRTSKDEVVFFDDFVITEPAAETEPPAEPRFLKVPSDDYPTIQDALDDANAGDTVSVRGSHTANIVIDKAILFSGNSSTELEPADPYLPTITIASDGATVRRFQIDGGSLAVLVKAGVGNVLVDDIESQDSDEGIVVEPGCQDLIIKRSDFIGCQGDAVSVTGCSNVELFRVEARDNDRSGFILMDNQDLRLERCRAIRSQSDGFMIVGDGASLEKNLADSNQGTGFVIMSDNHEIFDNNAKKNGEAGFAFVGSDHNEVTENLSRSNDGAGFVWRNCSDNVVYDNVGQSNDGDGFAFIACTDCFIDSNFVDESGRSGFYFDAATFGSTLTDNRANENDEFGFLSENEDTDFSRNYARDNGAGDFS